jgi:Arc/MetJ family transcription regulator
MATNLALDDRLIDEAVKLGNHKSKREAVNTAIEEYIKQKKRLKVLDLMGTVEFRPDWDHKAARKLGNKRIPRA